MPVAAATSGAELRTKTYHDFCGKAMWLDNVEAVG
jgi:hypothetical protein